MMKHVGAVSKYSRMPSKCQDIQPSPLARFVFWLYFEVLGKDRSDMKQMD